jgi:hypothetical protein
MTSSAVFDIPAAKLRNYASRRNGFHFTIRRSIDPLTGVMETMQQALDAAYARTPIYL